MKNVGKKFEENFKKSIPENCFFHRLRDSAQSYNNSEKTKFSWDNECDFFLFDTSKRIFYAFELKTTKAKSMNYQESEEDKSSKNIKYHQINSLRKFLKYNNMVSGFIFNFRDEINNIERTYFQDIKDFDNMIKKVKKKSFDEIDLIQNNAVKISGVKKRINYSWDIDKFLKEHM